MPRLFVTPCMFLVALAGCGGDSESDFVGLRPPNVPENMTDARPPALSKTPEERAKLVGERLKEASAASDRKDFNQAIGKLRDAILLEPKDRKVISGLARAYNQKSLALSQSDPGESYRSSVSAAEYLRVLSDYYPERSDEEKSLAAEVYFNEATQQAKSMRLEETNGALNDALGAGFTDIDRIRNSPDWKRMLELPQFKKSWEDISKRFPEKK